ncbi:hypothetical protein GCM10009801_59370 [Streptomyces albiaxialis]|uniref:Lipoprotein n=1 Tax=Streptomyces albiaxialis TaxID=329523 RepID=A0ABN2WHV7_9ACTN
MSRLRPRALARRALPLLLAAQAVLLPAGLVSGTAHAQQLSCPPTACGSVSTGPVSQAPPSEGPCTSPDKAVCLVRSQTPEEREKSREIRVRYHELLAEMDRTECEMRTEGRSEEEIARKLVQMRNEAKHITRAGMSPDEVRVLEERNRQKYGNPLGPTADQLYAKYGSWRAVSDAAGRTSVAVDHELGLEYRPCGCEAERAA